MTPNRSALAMAMAAMLMAAVPLASACGDDDPTPAETTSTSAPPPVIDPGDRGDYDPDVDPQRFVATIDNPYLPLRRGSTWTYDETNDEGEVERIEVEVLDETREVAGITATVVRDTVTLDGVLVEDTLDWFAQDVDGNVWYLGEAVDNYDAEGTLADHDGSWEHGVDGALAGIVMLAEPQVGDAYRQEYWLGEAEDLGEVVRVGETVTVPAGRFEEVLVTQDWNPLEPAVVEEKWYAPGVGLVYETKVRGGPGEGVLLDADRVGR